MTKIISSLSALQLFFYLLTVNAINEQCQVFNVTRIKCSCIGNEEFMLPEGYNYENVTSVELSSCSSANLHFSSLTEANRIEELIVQNISTYLTLELFITSRRMKKLIFSNIGRIPLVTHDTFISLESIELFKVENTEIENFTEQFDIVRITDFIMRNVTVERIEGVNLSERGNTLKIINCKFNNVATSFNLAYFSEVEIINSKFELTKPGQVSIEGAVAILVNNVFINASINIVTVKGITIKSTCADGRSSLRLSSRGKIESLDNRLPTEIVHTTYRMQNETELPFTRNNTVCIAGFCKCQMKSSGQNARLSIGYVFIIQLLLFIVFFFP